jgi:chloride channel protein, CIC family
VNRWRSLPPPTLSLLAILIGVVAGIGAVLFRGLIGIIHNLFFLGILSPSYDANMHTPSSPWGPLVILVPVIGAAGVAFLVQHFAVEAKGHGVPEVMEAIYYHKAVIRPVVAAIKALASALSIGTGGAVGREGPIIQIGAAFGSAVAQILRMPIWQRITMIAAGAAGGIAATFNTPIGGVLFALEIILHEISVRTLVPVVISTATAAYVGRIFFGDHPSFFIPALETLKFQTTAPSALVSYVGLGIVLGAVSALFIKSIYVFEDLFEQRISHNYYAHHMIGMFVVGVMMYAMMMATGHYYIQGVGYATIQDVLEARLTSGGLLLIGSMIEDIELFSD